MHMRINMEELVNLQRKGRVPKEVRLYLKSYKRYTGVSRVFGPGGGGKRCPSTLVWIDQWTCAEEVGLVVSVLWGRTLQPDHCLEASVCKGGGGGGPSTLG